MTSKFWILAPLLVAAGLGGCGGIEAPEPQSRIGMNCVDDSLECISQRQTALKGMVGDPGRKWVKEPATIAAYASGVRLFAFKTKKKELNCDELAIGRREADAGPAVLRGASGGALSPAQISRGVMLAQEISRELGNEMGRRCKKA